MKTVYVFVALVSVVLGEAPLPRKLPADNPRGVYFVLPPAPQLKQHITPDQVEEIMSQLRGEEGSDSGLYHIVLPDGRLQRVEYTTAPIKQEVESEEAPVEAQPASPARILAHSASQGGYGRLPHQSNLDVATPQPAGPAALLAHSSSPAQFKAPSAEHPQNNYPQIRLAKVDTNGKLRLVSSIPEEKYNKGQIKQEESSAPAKYVASVQYTEVQPIPGPIYSYNDQPLNRVLRYAPLYY